MIDLAVGFSLSTTFSAWYILLCLLAGAVFAVLLYWRDRKNDFSRKLLISLAVLRGLAVSLISFLLLMPLIQRKSRTVEKPIVVMAMDNSSSIVVGKDSAFYRKQFIKNYNELAGSLSDQFDIRQFTFGQEVKEGSKGDFSEKLTDISQLFADLNNRYANRNLAALVLATDGIYNSGTDPVSVASDVPYSIYTVALGDTSRPKDISVSRVNYNRIAYLGNDFLVEITISADHCTGAKGKVTLSSGNETLFTEGYSVVNEHYTATLTAKLKASKPGIQHYRVAISPVDGESTKANNYRDIYIEVMDGRQKILLLYASPHPDIAAIRQSVESNRNYEVEAMAAPDFKGTLSTYSLLILHQLPSVNEMAFQVFNQLKTSPIPVLFIIGSQSNLPAYNALGTGVSIPVSNTASNDASAVLNKEFSLFSVSPDVAGMLQEYPPLDVPFGQYKIGATAQVLLDQRIGNVITPMPLFLFNQGIERRSATIMGEGIWRWRLADFLKSGNQQSFDELMSKTIQYLASKDDKSRFRIQIDNQIPENKDVEIDAELYDKSFELVNTPEVNIVVTDSAGKNYPYAFTRTAKAYYLNAGNLPPGDYHYKASTALAQEKFEKSGNFSVTPLAAEFANLTADHAMLHMLAASHQGKMVGPQQLDQLKQMLLDRKDLKPLIFTQKQFTDLVGYIPYLLVLLALLAAEWVLRKRNGSY